MKFNKLFKRSILGDYDRDGVMNAFDCQPKNKKKQDAVKNALRKTDEETRKSISEDIRNERVTYKEVWGEEK